jgi:hypothetical protein
MSNYYPEDENEDVQEFVESLDKSYKSCLLYLLIVLLIGAVALMFKK